MLQELTTRLRSSRPLWSHLRRDPGVRCSRFVGRSFHLPKSPPRPAPRLRCGGTRRRGIWIADASGLRIENRQTVLASQLPNETIHILRLGPDARHDNVARRTVERTTPRAIVVVVNPVVWNGVNLWVLRGQLLVKSIYRWMRSRTLHRAFAKPDVKFVGIVVTESLVRIPNSKVVAHARVLFRPTKKVSDGGGPRRANSQTASASRHSLHCLVRRSHVHDAKISAPREILSATIPPRR